MREHATLKRISKIRELCKLRKKTDFSSNRFQQKILSKTKIWVNDMMANSSGKVAVAWLLTHKKNQRRHTGRPGASLHSACLSHQQSRPVVVWGFLYDVFSFKNFANRLDKWKSNMPGRLEGSELRPNFSQIFFKLEESNSLVLPLCKSLVFWGKIWIWSPPMFCLSLHLETGILTFTTGLTSSTFWCWTPDFQTVKISKCTPEKKKRKKSYNKNKRNIRSFEHFAGCLLGFHMVLALFFKKTATNSPAQHRRRKAGHRTSLCTFSDS